MELNIKPQLLCNRTSFINHIANMLTSKPIKYKNINMTNFMRVVLFLFSIHKVVRPADADEIANLVHHLKRLGTADIYEENARCLFLLLFL